jgi:hypothetical protein
MAQNMEDVNAVLQFAQIAQGAGPEGQLALKVGDMLDFIAERLGVPAKLVASPAERALKMEQAMQMTQQLAEQNPQAAQEAIGQAVQGGM